MTAKCHEGVVVRSIKVDAEGRQATGSSSHEWLDEATRNRMFRWSRPTKRGGVREAQRAIRQERTATHSWRFAVTWHRALGVNNVAGIHKRNKKAALRRGRLIRVSNGQTSGRFALILGFKQLGTVADGNTLGLHGLRYFALQFDVQ